MENLKIHIHNTLSPGKKDSYTRMFYIDRSSGFNTTIPSKLTTRLHDLGLHHVQLDLGFPHLKAPDGPPCQVISETLIMNTGCVLGPMLFTQDSVTIHVDNITFNFAGYTRFIGLITGKEWQSDSKHQQDPKIKEMVVDLMRPKRQHKPLLTGGDETAE